MKGRIDRSNLKKLPKTPASKSKIWLWDPEIKGFGAYRSADDRVSFVYQYRMPGDVERTMRSKLLGHLGEVTVEIARSRAAELAALRWSGVDPVAQERQRAAEEQAKIDLLLSNYAAAYLQRRIDQKKPLNKAQTKVVTHDIVGALGHIRIDRMTIDDVEAFATKLGERAESARRQGIVYLKSILNDAVNRGRISVSPAKSIGTPKAGKRLRRLREKEIKRFYEAVRDLGDTRGDVMEVLLRTSKRKEEIGGMLWEEVDLAKGTWFLPPNRAKPREGFLVELPRQVVEIIRRQQPNPKLRHGHVFTLNGETSTALGSQIKELIDANMHRRIELAEGSFSPADRVAHFTIHDVRKVPTSMLQERPFLVGKDILDVILLHKGSKTQVIETYALSKLEIEAGEALQKWNDWLDELIAQAPSFPGGRDLPRMKPLEVERRCATFREGWPERAHQKAARERREADAPAAGIAPRGRVARAQAAYRQRMKQRKATIREGGEQ